MMRMLSGCANLLNYQKEEVEMEATMDRRRFLESGGKVALVTAVAGAAVAEEGCSVSQWLQTALNDLPTILQVVTQIVNIVGLYSSVATPDIQAKANAIAAQVKTDMTTVQTWVTQYQANKSTTLLGQIYDALSTTQANLDSILAMFHVYNTNLQAALGIAITSALAAIVAIQTLMPAPVPATSVTAVRTAARAAAVNNNHGPAIVLFYNEAMAAVNGPLIS